MARRIRRLRSIARAVGAGAAESAHDALEHPAAAVPGAAVERGRAQIQSDACCVIPGFLPPPTLEALRSEAVEDLLGRVRPFGEQEKWGEAYSQWVEDSPEYGPDHPRHRLHKTRVDFVGYSDFPSTSRLRRLYEAEEMAALVSSLVGERMYQCVDSSRSLNLSVMQTGGDTHGWHYDTNTAVVSLVIEAPQAGGEFEWAPFSRDEGSENYDEMARVFDGTSSLTRRHTPVPGDLLCFVGRRSVHRVAEQQAGRRIVALLSFANEPDFYWKHLKEDPNSVDPAYTDTQ
jgi:hypothetical protein